MFDLDAHYLAGVRKFLQTAIVIDDQAEFAAAPPVPVMPPLQRPNPSIIDRSAAREAVPGPAAVVEVPADNSPPAAGEPVDAVEQAEFVADEAAGAATGADGALDAKALSEAFLAKNMICGLYRPGAEDDMVAKTAGAARSADIVVVDWHLQPGTSLAAKSIIKSVLEADAGENGRLRLIAVYTSQPGRAEMAADLLRDIEAQPVLQGLLRAEDTALVGTDTRIVFLNKRGTSPSADLEEVAEADLPERLVIEFAKLSDGLLATFAIASVAAIRRGVHHVLALYGEDLDGAYVAHRCALPHPDDAIAFASDLIGSELKNLIDLDDAANKNLNAEVIGAWLARLTAAGHVFQSNRAVIPSAEVAKFIKGGLAAVKASHDKQHQPNKPNAPAGKERKIVAGALPRVFYVDADKATEATRALARLSTFQRERVGRARLPAGWRPTLVLGCIVQAWPVAETPELLLCMQPRCDSVRLDPTTAFPFQTIDLTGPDLPDFNVALRDANGDPHEAWVNLRPRDSRMLRFARDDQSKTVRATVDGDHFVFTDVDGRKYAWLGDLKEMKAQKWAGDLGHRVLGIGLDDLEWLRTASERQISRNWV